MDNLEPVKEEPVKEADKKELKKAIANAEKYTRVDYTEESWNDFQTALQAAYLVDNNTAATQKEVDDALQALQTAIKNLKKVQEEVKKDDIRKYIEKAQKLNKEDYTKESWDALQEALKEAVEAANKDDVTQAEIEKIQEKIIIRITIIRVMDRMSAIIMQTERIRKAAIIRMLERTTRIIMEMQPKPETPCQ